MASKGKITEIIDIASVQKQIEAVNQGLGTIISKMEEVAGTAHSLKFDFGNAKNLKDVAQSSSELGSQMKVLGNLTKEIAKLEDNRAKLLAKQASLETEAAKQTAQLNLEIRKRNSELNIEAKLNSEKVGSLNRLTAELTQAKNAFKAMSEEERRGAAGQEMLQKIQVLTKAVTETEHEIGEFFRQVGNYEIAGKAVKDEMMNIAREMAKLKIEGLENSEAFQTLAAKLGNLTSAVDGSNISLREQRRIMTEQLALMKKNGLEGTEAYEKLRQSLGELVDTMQDVSAEAKVMASDTKKLDQVLIVAEGLTGAYTAIQGATTLLGVENEELMKTFVKLQGAMAVLNGLRSIQNVLQKESAAYIMAENIQRKAQLLITNLQTSAEGKGIVVRKAAAAAQWLLNKAMAANPAGLLLASIVALVAAGYGLYKIFSSNADIQEKFADNLRGTRNIIQQLNKDLETQVKMMEAFGESEFTISNERLKVLQAEYDKRQELIDSYSSQRRKLSKEQRKELDDMVASQKETLQKISDIETSRTVWDIKMRQEAQKERLNAMQDGLSKELALLKLDYDNKRKQAEGNNEMIAALNDSQAKKEKEIRKKYADEYLKMNEDITRKLTESTISLMDEGFEKELAQLRESYRQKISEIENQLKTETKLTVEQRKMLNQVLQNLIKEQNKKEEELIREAEINRLKIQQTNIQTWLDAENEGSERYLQLRLEMLELQRKIEVEEAIKTGAEVAAINAKYEKLKADTILGFTDNAIKKAGDSKLLEYERQYANEKAVLAKQYADGLINTNTFQKQVSERENKYALLRYENAIDIAQKELDKAKELGLDTTEQEKALKEAQIALDNEKTDQFIANRDKEVEAQQKANEKIKELAKVLYAGLTNMINAHYESRLAALDRESKADEEAKSKELANEGLTQAAKDRITANYEAKEAEREKKRRQIQMEQAKFKKQMAIFEILINTASAVVEALPNLLLAGLASAIGAAQLAFATAQPLPKYFKGREDGEAEFAWVGEQGTEAIRLRSGKTFLTPDKPTVVYLPEHAEVIPHHELLKAAGEASLPVFPLIDSSGTKELERKIEGLHEGFRMLADVIKNKTETHIVLDKNGFTRYLQSQNRVTKWIEDNFKN